MDENINYYMAAFAIDGFCFTFYTIAAGFTLWRLNFKLDTSALLTIATYEISFVIRFSNWAIFISSQDSMNHDKQIIEGWL